MRIISQSVINHILKKSFFEKKNNNRVEDERKENRT